MFVGPSLSYNPWLALAVGAYGATIVQLVWEAAHEGSAGETRSIAGRWFVKYPIAWLLDELPFLTDRQLRRELARLARRGILTKARVAGVHHRLYAVNSDAVAAAVGQAVADYRAGRRRRTFEGENAKGGT